ncbi:hypothetical protein [Sandaracinus amylolyticus]|uniref:Uncharacterized protein n=1 Tax=Sandaracinus amylolyticus TaxID=927083 RepID=A0A0F6W7Q8_9BACT|nr:hypothetical protein [Sandaracinus amylolyticus]AKF09561.1 hypothetical protein DB32_006710 [Sandaracinus amylolyticus]
MASKKRTDVEPQDLGSAIRDTKSEAWRALVARTTAAELDAALAGVSWSQPRANDPGSFTPNALFSGRGKAKNALMHRLVAVAAAARGPNAEALRASVGSLALEGDASAPLDLEPLAAFPSLRCCA